MPPTLVRLSSSVRVRRFIKISLAINLLLAFAIVSAQHAAAERMRRASTEISSTRLYVSGNLPQGTVGVAYSGAINVRRGVAPYTFRATGSLPPGLSLNQADG